MARAGHGRFSSLDGRFAASGTTRFETATPTQPAAARRKPLAEQGENPRVGPAGHEDQPIRPGNGGESPPEREPQAIPKRAGDLLRAAVDHDQPRAGGRSSAATRSSPLVVRLAATASASRPSARTMRCGAGRFVISGRLAS